MKNFCKSVLFALAFVCLSTSTVSAQEQGDGRAPASKRKKISFGPDEFLIQGKIVKPQVQFIISRDKRTSDEALELKESFVPKILDSVQQPPF